MRNLALGSVIVAAGAFCVIGACGGAADSSATGPGAGVADSGVTGDAASPPAGPCEAFGRYGKPAITFELPVVGSGAAATLAYADLQESFPSVDWAHLDRLYLPAGRYVSLMLGNLPARDPAHPLVITNKGGQVFVGNNPKGQLHLVDGRRVRGNGRMREHQLGVGAHRSLRSRLRDRRRRLPRPPLRQVREQPR